MSRPASAARRGLLVPGIFALAAFIVLIGLGAWQVERKAWKEALIATLTQRLAAPPGALPAPDRWASLSEEHDEFRRASFAAAFLNDKEALVYAGASAFRPDVSGPGYWVFTPARLADGHLVMVERGFVPEGRQDPKTRPQGQLSGPTAIVGALRWPETSGWFTPASDPEHNLWFVRDPAGIAKSKEIGPVAPFYVAQEAPIPPGDLPKPGPLSVHLRNEHLQYAITWFGLATVLLVVFMSFVMSRRRQA